MLPPDRAVVIARTQHTAHHLDGIAVIDTGSHVVIDETCTVRTMNRRPEPVSRYHIHQMSASVWDRIF
jgi:hypothetical protein